MVFGEKKYMNQVRFDAVNKTYARFVALERISPKGEYFIFRQYSSHTKIFTLKFDS